MTEHTLEHKLEGYAAGSLSAVEFLSVDDHLAECVACRNRLAQLKHTDVKTGSLLSQFRNAGIEHLQYQDLEAYVDRSCDPIDREIVESHLQDCVLCSQQVSELEKLTRAKRSFSRKVIFLWKSPDYSAPFRLVAAAAVVAFFAFLLALVSQFPDRDLQTRLKMETEQNLRSRQELRIARRKIAQLEHSAPSDPLLASLRDNSATVGITKSGTLLGAQSYPDRYQQLVRTTFQDQRIPVPEWVSTLAGENVTLMGSNSAQSFHLKQPIGVVVETNRPSFAWQPLKPGAEYRVDVFNSQFRRIATSGMLRETSWTPSVDLPRGVTYLWKVTAFAEGMEIVSPIPPEPEAKFKVLEAKQLAELNLARRDGSHLWLGLVYADSGMIRESRTEFELLARENPDTPLAEKLLESFPKK